MKTATYPEHDKLRAISEQSQAIGEFIDWLAYEKRAHAMHDVQLWDWCEPLNWRRAGPVFGPPVPDDVTGFRWIRRCHALGHRQRGPHWCTDSRNDYGYWRQLTETVPLSTPIQDLLAEFFDIDQDRLEAEKRAMLDALRGAA